MKKKFVFILTVLMLCLCFVLFACGEAVGSETSGNGGETSGETSGNDNTGHDDDPTYTVTFDSQGGSAVESERVLAGNPATAPTSPTRENFDFDGWFRSADENAARWNFSTDRVNENLTLYAHWTATSETPAPTATLTFERNTAGNGYIVTGDSGQAANIVIPETYDGLPVVGIADSAFAYSRHTSDILCVTIPDSVIEIGKNAFHNQDALVSVKIGEGSRLEKIGNNAFSGNSALESIYLPANFSELGDDVFNNCGGLNTITVAAGNTRYSGAGNCLIDLETNTLIRGSNHSVIPETVQTIGVAAFRRATMTTLTIPQTVTSIEKYAISDSAITKVVFEGTSEEWDSLMAASSKYWNMGKDTIEVVCSDTAETRRVLVAYFSATGTTKGVAEKIANITGGTLYEIVPQVPYTPADLNYNSDCRANNEQNDSAARPAISGSVADMESYDVIFLGYPIWWGKAPKIIYTFLESYEWAGKTIIPFCTSGSSPIDGSLADLQAIANDATWRSGRRFSGGATQDAVGSWINSLQE